VNEEIRLGRMSRQKGIELVELYDDSCSPYYIESFCDYIQISPKEFWEQVRRSANRDLFSVDDKGDIRRKFEVGVGL